MRVPGLDLIGDGLPIILDDFEILGCNLREVPDVLADEEVIGQRRLTVVLVEQKQHEAAFLH